jgi:PAS domain S-box-containing protein
MPAPLHKLLAGLIGGHQPRRRWIAAIIWTIFLTLVLLTLYEMAKYWFFPDITPLQSRIVTVLFTAVLTGAVTHLALRVYHELLQETTDQISERMRVSEQLLQERNFMRALMDYTPDHIYFKDTRGRYLRVNKALADACGLPNAGNAVGRTAADFYASSFAAECRQDEDRILGTGEPLIGKEERATWPDGRSTWVSSTKLPLLDATGRIIGTFGLSRDITAQKNTEDRLRQLSTAVEQSPSLVVIASRSGEISYVNPRFCQVTGFAPAEMIGRQADALLPAAADPGGTRDVWQQVLAGNAWQGEFLHARKDGDTFWASASMSPIRNASGDVTHIIAVMEDVTEKKRTEAARTALMEGLQAVLDMTDELISCRDEEELFRRAVELSRERLGLERCSIWIDCGTSVQGTFGTSMARETTDERAWVLPRDGVWQDRLRQRSPAERHSLIVQEPHSDWDGKTMAVVGEGWIAVTPIQSSGREVIGVLCNDTAITHAPPDDVKQEVVVLFCTLLGNVVARKRAERERVAAEIHQREFMERADRLNSLGMLAAGMAHEINNPLQGMLSHLHAVQRSVPKDFPARSSIDMVSRGIETIANLVRRLLTFGVSEQTGDATAAREAIDFTVQLLESQFKRARVKIAVEHRRDGVQVAMPRRELTQVLLNLLINAKDAMPGGGRIAIINDADAAHGIIRIGDTGDGIPPDIRGKIFTPFFTTKGTKGTGLGLSVAESLVRGPGGTLEVESTPGKGTVFTLRIPIATVKQQAVHV